MWSHPHLDLHSVASRELCTLFLKGGSVRGLQKIHRTIASCHQTPGRADGVHLQAHKGSSGSPCATTRPRGCRYRVDAHLGAGRCKQVAQTWWPYCSWLRVGRSVWNINPMPLMISLLGTWCPHPLWKQQNAPSLAKISAPKMLWSWLRSYDIKNKW